MVPVSVHDTHEFTPASARERTPPPVFVLRTPSLRQRAAWRRDIAAAGARYVGTGELAAMLRQALRELGPDNVDELVELIDQAEAMGDGKLAPDRAVLERVQAIEADMQVYTPLAELTAARAYWLEISTLLAFRHFVIGWRDVGVDFVARAGLVDEGAMRRLPEAWVYAVGAEAIGLTAPSGDQVGNSESPRPSPSGPATSPALTPSPDGAGA